MYFSMLFPKENLASWFITIFKTPSHCSHGALQDFWSRKRVQNSPKVKNSATLVNLSQGDFVIVAWQN